MYTVIRVTADGARLEEFWAIGESMNEVRAHMFQGLRRAGDGFSCDICDDAHWSTHRTEILKFMDEFSISLQMAQTLGVSVTIDVAIEPEDIHESAPVEAIRCDSAFLRVLADRGVDLEFSMYL